MLRLSTLTTTSFATLPWPSGQTGVVLARLTLLALDLLQSLLVDQSRLEQLLVQGIPHPVPLGLGRSIGAQRL
jgi:hypothetical protein